ncbi:MAG: hypothetical protein WBD26_08660, partial [Candidatus Acidiferrales bacterium]
ANLTHLKAAARIFDRLARQRNWAAVDCMEDRKNELRPPSEIHRDVMAILQARVFAQAEEA